MDPILHTLSAIQDDVEHVILVDNQYSMDYLMNHDVESVLITENMTRRISGIKIFFMNIMLKLLAMKSALQYSRSIEYVSILSLGDATYTMAIRAILYRIAFCDDFNA